MKSKHSEMARECFYKSTKMPNGMEMQLIQSIPIDWKLHVPVVIEAITQLLDKVERETVERCAKVAKAKLLPEKLVVDEFIDPDDWEHTNHIIGSVVNAIRNLLNIEKEGK